MKNQEISSLGTTFVVLGIIFGADQIIGYLFIGFGVFLSIFSLIQDKKKNKLGGNQNV
jgi:hypothetical protein